MFSIFMENSGMMESTEFGLMYFVFNLLLCTQCVSVWAHMGQSVCVEARGQLQVSVLTSFLETKISLFCCDAKLASLQTSRDSRFCLPSHCRSTEITGVHTRASGSNMDFGNLNSGPHTCRSTLTYGVNPQLSTVFKYKALLLCQVGRC